MRLFLFFCLATGISHAATSAITLRVGASRADISPEPKVLNWVTGKAYGEVLEKIYVHALVLDDGITRAALLRYDIVDISESLRDEVRKVVGEKLGMPGENIFLHASHNHSAPWAPVYGGDYRGKERDTWWAIRHMPAQNEFPPFRRWMARLLEASVEVTKAAAESAVPATMAIGRIAAPELLYNRRPRAAAWGIEGKLPSAVGYGHKDWHPEVAQLGASFGPMDRALSLVSFRGGDDKPLATLFHLACHAVSMYPSTPAINADWPGPASQALSQALGGGESLFLQGCAGEITPGYRGAKAVAEMAAVVAQKSQIALKFAVKLKPEPIRVARASVELPLTPVARQRTGTETIKAEVQVLVCGPLAIVGLPGEPLTELGLEIREASPFPQTLVLGYSNGNGVHYVGMPHEKARGGYEMGVAGAGAPECGPLLVAAAQKMLADLFAQRGN